MNSHCIKKCHIRDGICLGCLRTVEEITKHKRSKQIEKNKTKEIVKSPCTKKCRLVEDICLGCFRSLDEITKWRYSTHMEKNQILENIKMRKLQSTENEI